LFKKEYRETKKKKRRGERNNTYYWATRRRKKKVLGDAKLYKPIYKQRGSARGGTGRGEGVPCRMGGTEQIKLISNEGR